MKSLTVGSFIINSDSSSTCMNFDSRSITRERATSTLEYCSLKIIFLSIDVKSSLNPHKYSIVVFNALAILTIVSILGYCLPFSYRV